MKQANPIFLSAAIVAFGCAASPTDSALSANARDGGLDAKTVAVVTDGGTSPSGTDVGTSPSDSGQEPIGPRASESIHTVKELFGYVGSKPRDLTSPIGIWLATDSSEFPVRMLIRPESILVALDCSWNRFAGQELNTQLRASRPGNWDVTWLSPLSFGAGSSGSSIPSCTIELPAGLSELSLSDAGKLFISRSQFSASFLRDYRASWTSERVASFVKIGD